LRKSTSTINHTRTHLFDRRTTHGELNTLSPVNSEILNSNVRLTDRATRLNDHFHSHTPQIRRLNTPYSELDSIIIVTSPAVLYKHTQ